MQARLLGLFFCLALLTSAAHGQSSLSGVIDIHAHTNPDSLPRSLDAIDLARLAKQRGIRGIVLKNHYEPTMRKPTSFGRKFLVSRFSAGLICISIVALPGPP